MNPPSPQDIESAAYDARISILELCKRAGVSHSTFYRALRGAGKLRPLTAAKLMDAIQEHSKAS
jgi:AcrR family transcriptional regulator